MGYCITVPCYAVHLLHIKVRIHLSPCERHYIFTAYSLKCHTLKQGLWVHICSSFVSLETDVNVCIHCALIYFVCACVCADKIPHIK